MESIQGEVKKMIKKNDNEEKTDPMTIKTWCYGNPYYGIYVILEEA